MKLKAFGAALLLSSTALAQTAPPAEAPKPQFTFALHGFVGVSGAYQDGTYGLSEGQQSLDAGARPSIDKQSLNFDVRQSRFNFSVKGPQVLSGATPAAVLEIDFFGGFSAGAFGEVSLYPRMRTAYSELAWKTTKLQLGQQNDIIFAQAPTSLSHIAFPLGYFTGNIGWRRPGLFIFQTLPLAKDFKLELAGEIGRSQWADAAAAVGGNFANQPGGVQLGEASGAPALEGRATVSSKAFTVWAAGHYNQVDKSGIGAGGGNPSTFNVQALAAGAKVTPGPLTLAAVGFSGKNTDALLGNFAQFAAQKGPTTTAPTAANTGSVTAWGYWAQLGFNLTKEFSLWGLFGQQKPNEQQARNAGMTILKNQTTNIQAIYREGGYGLSAEWINFKTKYAATNANEKANQFMVSANYFF